MSADVAVFGLGVLAGLGLSMWIQWKLDRPQVRVVQKPRRWIQ